MAGVASAGGYGAPFAAMSLTEGGVAYLSGGRGGWVIDNRLVIGGQGVSTDGIIGDGEGMAYGGLFIESILAPEAPIHPTIEVSAGGGYIWRGGAVTSATITGGAARAELVVAPWMRVAAGLGYTISVPITGPGGPWALGRPSAELLVKFGSF